MCRSSAAPIRKIIILRERPKTQKKTHPKLLHHKRVEEAERYRVRVANGERNKETASVTKIKFQFSIKISILVVILVIISHQIQI